MPQSSQQTVLIAVAERKALEHGFSKTAEALKKLRLGETGLPEQDTDGRTSTLEETSRSSRPV